MKKKILLTIVISILVVTTSLLLVNNHKQNKKEIVSKQLQLCFHALDKKLNNSEKTQMKNCKNDKLIEYNFGLGLYIRNYWIRRNGLNINLSKYLFKKGLKSPDDMSMFIIKEYHRYLNNKCCSENSDLLYSKVDFLSIDKNVETFINNCNDKNGIYLYEKGNKKEEFLFLNGQIINQGQKAPYFFNVKIKSKKNTLVISFNEKYTEDYKNKKITNKVLYKINIPKNIDTIEIYKNGKQTHFDTIGI